MKNYLIGYLSVIIIVGMASCDIKNNKIDPAMGFTKIYDIDSAEANHFAIDIKQKSDDGYLLLGYDLSTEANTQIISTDKDGKLGWAQKFPQYLDPISDLMKIGNDYYFVSSKALTFEIVILKINDATKTLEEITSLDESKRPLAACKTPDNGILILTYDFFDNQSVLLKLNAAFALDNNFSRDGKKEFRIRQEELMADKINNHLNYRGARLPFFVSYIGESTANSYVFNGINLFDIRLTTVNTTTGAEQGGIDAYRYRNCINSFTYLGNNKAALSKFEDANTFFSPNISTTNLSNGSTVNINQLVAEPKAEVVANSAVKSSLVTIKGKKLVIYIAELKNSTVGLFAYDANTGAFAGSRYFGSTYPNKVGNIVTTSDGGLAILCQTYIAGRFGRMCLYKLSKEQAESFIQ